MEDEDDRARFEAIKRRMGILPPIVDKNGIAEKEIAEALATIEFCVEKLKLRIGVARPLRNAKDDAYWESDWALYSDDELLNNLIGAAMRAGAYRLDTPIRQILDRRRVGSRSGKASGIARTKRAKRDWQDTVVEMAKSIRAKNPNLKMAAIATNIEKQWEGELPVGYRRLYQFLCRCKRS